MVQFLRWTEYSDARQWIQCVYDRKSVQIRNALMGTNIKIDDKHLSKVMRATVERGLQPLARKNACRAILALRGKVHWKGDSNALRSSKRR